MAVTVALAQRLPVSPSSAAKRQEKQSVGSAPATANVQSRQTNKRPSLAISSASPGPIEWDVSNHFVRRHRSLRLPDHWKLAASRIAFVCVNTTDRGRQRTAHS